MVRVGVIGLGFMGITHLGFYDKNPLAQIVAIADKNEDVLAGKGPSGGNIAGVGDEAIDFSSFKKYTNPQDLINDPEVDLVDICLWTPLHVPVAKAALAAGKHVLLEKPLARDSKGCAELIAAAKNSKGKAMVAMCMRFWPGWDWLHDVVKDKRYGKTLFAKFSRWGGFPGGGFYSNGELSGGALLDTHIHDADFVQYCFGMPEKVSGYGMSRFSGEIDMAAIAYDYGQGGPKVFADVSWTDTKGWPFRMRYDVIFEEAQAVFDLGAEHPLIVYHKNREPEIIPLELVLGYELEIDHMLRCIENNVAPSVTFADGAQSIRLYEAELESIKAGKPVKL